MNNPKPATRHSVQVYVYQASIMCHGLHAVVVFPAGARPNPGSQEEREQNKQAVAPYFG